MTTTPKSHGFQGIHISHPGEAAQSRGERSQVWLAIERPSGSIISVPLSDRQIVNLIASAAKFLPTILFHQSKEEKS